VTPNAPAVHHQTFHCGFEAGGYGRNQSAHARRISHARGRCCVGVLALLIRTLLVVSEMRACRRLRRSWGGRWGGDRARALARACAGGAGVGAFGAGADCAGGRAAVRARCGRRSEARAWRARARSGAAGRKRARAHVIVLAVLLGRWLCRAVEVTGQRLFHGLAVAASALLILGYVLRSRLRGIERVELTRIAGSLRKCSRRFEREPRASQPALDRRRCTYAARPCSSSRVTARSHVVACTGHSRAPDLQNCGFTVGQPKTRGARPRCFGRAQRGARSRRRSQL